MEGVARAVSISRCAAMALLLVAGCQTSRPFANNTTSGRSESRLASNEAVHRRADKPGVVVAPASEREEADEVSRVAYQEPTPAEPSTPDSKPLITPPAPEAPDAPANGDMALDSADISGLTLSQLEAIALANNPSLRQAVASAHKSMGYRSQVGLYPNPSGGYNGSQLFDQNTDQHTAFIAQDIVTGNKLALNQAVLEQDVQIQLWQLEAQRRRIVTDVRQGFYETLGAQRRLKLSAEFVHLVDEAARITQRRFDAGEASQPDVLQTEIQLNQVQLVRRQAGLSLRGAWRQLAALVGQPDMAQGELEGDLPTSAEPHDWDAVYLSLVQQSPELSAAQAKVCRARAYWDRQNVQPIPNISAQLSAGRDRGTNNSLMNAQVEIPLPIWNRNQGNTYAAYSEYSRASQDFERQKLALKSRLAVAARDYDSAAVAVDLYQTEILPKADRTLTLSQQAYAAGQTDFLQVLIVRRTYFESNLSFVQAQTDLAKSQALIDGLLLTGGLDSSPDTDQDSALRDQTLNGQ